jgi:basic amino acid/polyamine antiporter, APA family
VSTTSAEAKNPQRAVPIGIIASLVICTVLYMAFGFVLTGMVNYKDMHGDASPVATAIERTPYAWLQIAVKGGVILGFTSVLLVGLLGQARVLFAMAEDGMVPRGLAKLHPTRKTPWVGHLVMMVLTGLVAGFVPVETLSKLTSVGTLLAFVLVCSSVLLLRAREPERERPFRIPLGPVVPVLGIVTCLGLLAFLPWETWVRLVVWLVLGLVVYALYSHRRAAATRQTEPVKAGT